MGQKFCENVENQANVNYCDKIFVIMRGKPMPIVDRSKFLRIKFFLHQMANHEIYENTVYCATKFGTTCTVYGMP